MTSKYMRRAVKSGSKKQRIMAMLLIPGLLLLSGCGDPDAICVISREASSGTRSAFTELFGVSGKDENGRLTDATTDTAEITNSSGVMLISVAENPAAIGYVSMGALNDKVKPLKIDGMEASPENVKNGTYPIKRAFCIVVQPVLTEHARDFVNFILSEAGQNVVEEAGYISMGSAEAYIAAPASGEVIVSGSSSVSPVMEKLVEAYGKVNGSVTVVLQTSDSTTGISDAADGLCDIGMISRELKDSEHQTGLLSAEIAMDGIVVIVHPENDIDDLTRQQVCGIYTGKIDRWSQMHGHR